MNVFVCWKVIHAPYVERKNPEQEKLTHKQRGQNLTKGIASDKAKSGDDNKKVR